MIPYYQAGRLVRVHLRCVFSRTAGALLLLPLLAGAAHAADDFWQASRDGQPLAALQRESTTLLAPPAARLAALRGKQVGRVDVTSQWPGNAWLESRLCLAGGQQCVPLRAGRLATTAFEGAAATSAFEVRHVVRQWGGGPVPLFVRTDLVVWYR